MTTPATTTLSGRLPAGSAATVTYGVQRAAGEGVRPPRICPYEHHRRKEQPRWAAVRPDGELCALCCTPEAARVLAGSGGRVIERDDALPETRGRSDHLSPRHPGYVVILHEVVVAWTLYHLRALQVGGSCARVAPATHALARGLKVSGMLAGEQIEIGEPAQAVMSGPWGVDSAEVAP